MDNEDAHDIYSSVEVFFCFVSFSFSRMTMSKREQFFLLLFPSLSFTFFTYPSLVGTFRERYLATVSNWLRKDTLHSCTVCAVCFVETKCKYFQSDQRLLIFISILFRCSHKILTRVFTVQLAQVLGRKSKTSFCAIMCYKTENGTAMIGRRIRGKPPFLFLLR